MQKYFINILTFAGISSSDQQSLIQPKSILKQTSSDQSRYNGGSFSGQGASGYQSGGPMVSTATHRSLAESSTSGVSQVNHKCHVVGNTFLMNFIIQATLHSYDVTGHYPDLLDIPNRDMQTSPTATATTATSTFTNKVNKCNI